MRIAFFTDTYKPQINGVVRSIDLFSRELRRKNAVYIFSPSKIKEKFSYNFPSVGFKNYPGYRIALPYTMVYDNLFKRTKFDLVHVHSPFTMGLAGLILAKKRKIPVIGTFHTLLSEYLHYVITSEMIMHIQWVKSNLKKMSWTYLRNFYNECDAVVVPTEGIGRVLERNGIPKSKIHVIPTGIDIRKKKYTKNIKKKFGLKNKIILHTGRVTEEKNIDSIIRMMSPLLKKGEATLVITSDGPHKTMLEELVNKKGLDGSVVFTGYLSEEDLRGFYKAADVFVMASKTETQGLVLLEAAFFGLPSVVIEAPVVADFVTENKIGTVASTKGFARTVRKYLKKRQRIRTSSIKKKYDIKRCSQQLETLYQEVISNSQD